MPWRNSVFFPIVLLPLLAVAGMVGLLVFYSFPLTPRPHLLWYGSLLLGVGAIIGAIIVGKHLRFRLHELAMFLATTSEREQAPSLPVWNEDEVGALERGLQQVMVRHHERLRALVAERKKLEAVLQSMAEGVVVIDPAGHVILCNPAAQELFGLRPSQEWEGKPIQAFSRHPLLQELLREVANRRPGDAPVSRELQLENTEGRYLAASAMQICEDGVTVSGYVLVFYDLTQIKRLESVRVDFVANVSHELRTPLTAIKGYAETLLNGAVKDPATAQRFLEIIDRHSERLSRLIDDLLTLSNLELGRTELRKEDVVLADVVTEVFEIMKDKADQGGIALVHHCSPELPSLIGDSDRLQQVFVNLVDNAIKYTPAGGTVTVTAKLVRSSEFGVRSSEETGDWIPGTSSLSSQAPSEGLEITVTDTGCGIPAEELPRLTQRFYRVDKARSRELGGTGLGLAIVKHIVQAHHGLLRIESQLRQGTTVRIFLPL
ncbi:MAG: PAS domain-containing protein [Deltaproteobacteria bacterium]|nr:PAS domain-containing protein [Deltaproteobacteria bacterium]